MPGDLKSLMRFNSAGTCFHLDVALSADLHTVVSTTSRFGDVRLVGDTINGRGAVEIFTSSDWTTICPDNTWTDADAAIICQVLGYETGTAKT